MFHFISVWCGTLHLSLYGGFMKVNGTEMTVDQELKAAE